MKTIQLKRSPRSISGFSLMEVIGVVTVLALLATVAITSFQSTQGAVVQTKLLSDVTKLNSLVTIYQASGGSLAEAVTPQDVLDTLKTVRGTVDATQTVGPVTGRQVDVRLAARMQSVNEAATNAARVIWNPGSQKFEIAYSGVAGAASFVLDDSLADNDYGTETRADSNVKYNAIEGWVWKNDKAQGLAFLSPLNAIVSGAAGYSFDPSIPDGGASSTVIASLPPPSITPRGGSFLIANFITSVTISPGLLVSGSGVSGYMITREDGTSTGWLPYTAPFAITYGDTVVARNTTTDAGKYSDSPNISETYAVTPTLLTAPLITPAGGSYVASSWPAITIDANGAPVGPYTVIIYRITTSAGVVGAWKTYTGPIVTTYGDTVTAKNDSLNDKFYTDSATVSSTYNVTGSSKLPPPIFTQTTDAVGKKWVTISGDSSKMPIPAGARIYYTLTGVDPGNKSTEDPVTGTLFVAGKPLAVPTTVGTFFEITARMYPPTSDKIHFDTSDMADYDISIAEPGLIGGHIDVDTAHLVYLAGRGTTNAHVHAYDDKYATPTVNLMNFLDTKLEEIGKRIPAGTRFKLIVSNGALSPGGKLSINKTYNASDPTTYIKVTDYQNSAVAGLSIYSMDGVSGTVKLNTLTMNFSTDTLAIGGLIGTNTGAVRSNKPGLNGEYRNGALTIQAVKVNADGSNAFTTDVTKSNGGVQGVAATGLLWECTMFWHWHGPDYGG